MKTHPHHQLNQFHYHISPNSSRRKTIIKYSHIKMQKYLVSQQRPRPGGLILIKLDVLQTDQELTIGLPNFSLERDIFTIG